MAVGRLRNEGRLLSLWRAKVPKCNWISSMATQSPDVIALRESYIIKDEVCIGDGCGRGGGNRIVLMLFKHSSGGVLTILLCDLVGAASNYGCVTLEKFQRLTAVA
ncbi:hypothetical protein JTB14_033915 [Gonioctena quinquepunctata]|nr:hypothetical protein JTB14_033915 [Gonioctena quinquepunctata]